MVKNVLIVDDDTEMLATLRNGFARYEDIFAVLVAENGAEAIEALKQTAVSLVVTDLKMPRVDGFALLQHIMEHYPDLPVIVISGFSTPELESMALEAGAAGYIPKPFMLGTLARKIMTTLRRESEGGTLHSVSSGIFLQLIEMEQKTCTVRLVDKSRGRTGALFFRDGGLMDARVGELRGKAAAYEIFSWDTVTVSIQNRCPTIPDRIQSELQTLILEASRLKDESPEPRQEAIDGHATDALSCRPAGGEEIETVCRARTGSMRGNGGVQALRKALETHFGGAVGDIQPVCAWQPLLDRLQDIGQRFESGPLAACYIDCTTGGDVLLLPGPPPVEIKVKARCLRDRLLTQLTGFLTPEARKTP